VSWHYIASNDVVFRTAGEMLFYNFQGSEMVIVDREERTREDKTDVLFFW